LKEPGKKGDKYLSGRTGDKDKKEQKKTERASVKASGHC